MPKPELTSSLQLILPSSYHLTCPAQKDLRFESYPLPQHMVLNASLIS